MSAKGTGQHRKAVHRRRRAVALGAVLVVALVIAIVVWKPWEQIQQLVEAVSPSEAPATEAPEEDDPEQTDAPYTPVGGVPEGDEGGLCTADQVVITAATNAATYDGGQDVEMSFQIENVSDEPCSLNVGTTEQEYVVRTGEQVVYESTHCPVDAVDQVVELQPGTAQQTVPIVWDRTFSSPETCTTPRDAVVAGGASYHLSVTVAGISAQNTVQFILY